MLSQQIKQHVTAEKAAILLAANGLQISVEQAIAVVNYLYGLAKENFNHEESNIVHTGEHR